MRQPRIITTRSALAGALADTRRGLVPTMGALHSGHHALIARSARENPVTVVSVFVNPAQFHDPVDLARYPRDLDRDAAFAAAAGADLIFAPDADEVYPPGFDTTVEVGLLGARWEGRSRPGHFRGVATVVTILLNLVRPDRAYFGEKDFQQLQLIRRIHRDLALPGAVVGCPTVRDSDGLALSSRNARLSVAARERARAIPAAIQAAAERAGSGETNAGTLAANVRSSIEAAGLMVDYVEIVDAATLEPLDRIRPGAHLLAAAEIEGIRLIDNASLMPPAVDGQ